MDNRERYRKYKDRLSDQLGSRQTSFALTSKLKNIFTPWHKPNTTDKVVSSDNKITSNTTKGSQLEPKFLGSLTFKLPGSFHIYQDTSYAPAGSLKQPPPVALQSSSSSSIIDKDETVENPNDILSAFFKEKGNKKLTDVEYEGVMALMSKSRTGTPYKRQSTELSFNNEEPLLKRRNLGNDSTIVGNETSIIGSTPSRQKYLMMNGNTTLQTPGYTPKYHSVSNDTFERSYLIINNTTGSNFAPSSRRVRMRSRRPAPYKSRIKSSLLSKTMGNEETSLVNEDTLNIKLNTNTIEEKSRILKSPSKAAQTLMNILDAKNETGETSKELQQQQNNKLKMFINPYGSRSERKNNKNSKNASVLSGVTALTIGKTISYSRSDLLPKEVELKGNIKENENSGDAMKQNYAHKLDQQLTKTAFSEMGKSKNSSDISNTPTVHSKFTTNTSTDQAESKSKLALFSNGIHQPLRHKVNADNGGISIPRENFEAKNEVDIPSNDVSSNIFKPKPLLTTLEPSKTVGRSNEDTVFSADLNSLKANPIIATNELQTLERKQQKAFANVSTTTANFESRRLDNMESMNNANQLNGANYEASTSEFTFPSPQLVVYEFDDAEVNKYRSLFSF